jgi:RNA polymerase sigma-70 factor (ECF subfamily)
MGEPSHARDASLARRARAGERAAVDELVTAHRDRIYSLLLGMLRNPEDAADLTQETFIAALRHLDTFDGRSLLSTWLHRIAVRKALDFLRRRVPEPVDIAAAELAGARIGGPFGPGAGSAPVDDSLDGAALLEAIAALPEEFRATVLLVDVLGAGIDEAASALGVAPGTVKSRLFRGRARLAELLRSGTFGVDGASQP